MIAAKWKIHDTLYRRKPFGHSAWGKNAKVYCWWSSGILRFQLYGEMEQPPLSARCRRSFLRYHRSSRATNVTPKPNSARRSRRWLPNRGVPEKILHRISFANRSPSYWLFHSSSTRRRTELTDERNNFARSPPPWHIFLYHVRQFFFPISYVFGISSRSWLLRDD